MAEIRIDTKSYRFWGYTFSVIILLGSIFDYFFSSASGTALYGILALCVLISGIFTRKQESKVHGTIVIMLGTLFTLLLLLFMFSAGGIGGW